MGTFFLTTVIASFTRSGILRTEKNNTFMSKYSVIKEITIFSKGHAQDKFMFFFGGGFNVV